MNLKLGERVARYYKTAIFDESGKQKLDCVVLGAGGSEEEALSDAVVAAKWAAEIEDDDARLPHGSHKVGPLVRCVR